MFDVILAVVVVAVLLAIFGFLKITVETIFLALGVLLLAAAVRYVWRKGSSYPR